MGRSRVAAVYTGINPWHLTPQQVLGLHANIPRVEAMRLRQELRLRPELELSAEQMYNLVLAETDSTSQAEEAAVQYALAKARAEAKAGTLPGD